MSVPTHNLYDFVHQVTKRQFFLMYFYPWGRREIESIHHYQVSNEFFNGPNGIAINNRAKIPNLDPSNITYQLASQIQPMILCHDQEPLNFDLYLPDSDLMNHYSNLYTTNWKLHISDRIKNSNLRACNPGALQQKWILLHSELNSPEVQRYEDTGSFVEAYWWSHAIIARDWYRFAEYDTTIQSNNDYSKLFLAYCRDTTGSRQYRKDFLQQVEKAGLTNECQVQSMSNSIVGADSSAEYNTRDINSTAVNVVLETVFDRRIHLTEKTLRPIACGQPFILAAGPGSLALLRHYGFKTFDPYIDERYDTIINDQERLLAIVTAMKKFKQLTTQDRQDVLTSCQEIADFNRRHFFSDKFFKQITNELYTNVNLAYQSHENQLDFDTWWKERKWQRSINIKGVRSHEALFESQFSTPLVSAYKQIRRCS